jgi:hypothetical protein
MKNLIKAIAALSITLFFACSSGNSAGTISEVDIEIALIKGVVEDNFQIPLEGAELFIYHATSLDSVPFDTTYSLQDGSYQFDSINIGSYNITASYYLANTNTESTHKETEEVSLSGGLWGVNLDTITEETVELDTLRLLVPGTISGSVENYDGFGLVLVYIPGTSYMATVDTSGQFSLSGVVPDSGYSVAFEQFGFSPIKIDDISVFSGDTTLLSPVSLTPNQYPRNVISTYDSVNNTVKISWDEMDRSDIEGYIISRRDSSYTAQSPTQLNSTLVISAEFLDSLNDTLFSRSDSITFQYQVQGVTKVFGERTGYSRPVFVNSFIKRDSLDFQSLSVTTPVESEIIAGLSSFDVNWNYTGLIDSVKVFFTIDAGESWNPISGTIKNRGLFNWPGVYNVSSNLCQIRVINSLNSEVVGLSEQFTITKSSTDNILENGDFSEGVAYWEPNIATYAGAYGSFSFEEGVMHATVTKPGTQPWHFTLFQKPLHLQKNYLYEISFRAKADKPRELNVSLEQYYPAKWYATVVDTITTDWVNYKFTVSLNSFSDTIPVTDTKNGDLNIVIGNELGELWLDDIALKIVGIE